MITTKESIGVSGVTQCWGPGWLQGPGGGVQQGACGKSGEAEENGEVTAEAAVSAGGGAEDGGVTAEAAASGEEGAEDGEVIGSRDAEVPAEPERRPGHGDGLALLVSSLHVLYKMFSVV